MMIYLPPRSLSAMIIHVFANLKLIHTYENIVNIYFENI